MKGAKSIFCTFQLLGVIWLLAFNHRCYDKTLIIRMFNIIQNNILIYYYFYIVQLFNNKILRVSDSSLIL
jgi:hypothetical protein